LVFALVEISLKEKGGYDFGIRIERLKRTIWSKGIKGRVRVQGLEVEIGNFYPTHL